MRRKKKFTKKVSNSGYSVDSTFRNDWLNRSQIIGDEYFSVDI